MSTRRNENAIRIEENVALANFTTLKLGGNARYFVECNSVAQILSTLEFARRNHLRVHVLGGGSNTIVLDEGFEGLVLRIALCGIHFVRENNDVKLTVAAGEEWDECVRFCIQKNLAGVECLSGIPGLVGATPMQNVGAYGQEVSETIVEVKAIERATLDEVRFTNADCRFAYRRSRFNSDDANRFIIIEATFRLQEFGEPEIRYPELKRFAEANVDFQELKSGRERLQGVRDSVLALRRKKSMVIDAGDADSRSVGSFFKNAILSPKDFQRCEEKIRAENSSAVVPTFPAGESVKVPAAWLVENAGYRKGFRKGGVGVSSNHSLALVNYDGSTRELLALADEIQSTVFRKFGIRLEREPVVVR